MRGTYLPADNAFVARLLAITTEPLDSTKIKSTNYALN